MLHVPHSFCRTSQVRKRRSRQCSNAVPCRMDLVLSAGRSSLAILDTTSNFNKQSGSPWKHLLEGFKWTKAAALASPPFGVQKVQVPKGYRCHGTRLQRHAASGVMQTSFRAPPKSHTGLRLRSLSRGCQCQWPATTLGNSAGMIRRVPHLTELLLWLPAPACIDCIAETAAHCITIVRTVNEPLLLHRGRLLNPFSPLNTLFQNRIA